MRLVSAAACVMALGLACGDSTGGGGGGGRSTTITVNSNFFDPTPDTLPAGDVTFDWLSGTHNVTWLTGPTAPSNSGNRDPSSPNLVVTLQAGTYTYECTLHQPGMDGRIVVE